MLPAGTLKDKVAIVTGGGTGIGKVIASTLGSLGAKVVIPSRKQPTLESAVSALQALGIEAHSVPTDVRIPEQVDALVAGTVARFGRLDILVNNAAGNFISPAEDLSPNGFRTVVDIVLNGTFLCSRAAGRYWLGKELPGAIVNIIATYAWTAGAGVAHASAAKAGGWNLTMTLGAEWGPRGIRVHSVAPGIVATEQASKNRAVDDAQAQRPSA